MQSFLYQVSSTVLLTCSELTLRGNRVNGKNIMSLILDQIEPLEVSGRAMKIFLKGREIPAL